MKVLSITIKVLVGVLLVGMIWFGWHNVNHGMNGRREARAKKIEQVRLENLKSRSVKQQALETKRAQDIKAIRSEWGGPEVVDVLDTTYPLTRDNVLYVMTKLHVRGTAEGETILRPVPVELTDAKSLKFWWCKTASASCNPGYGQFYAIDDSRVPYQAAAAEASQKIDLDIAQAYKDAEVLPTQSSSVNYLMGAAFHDGFIVLWIALWLLIGFATYPSWRETAD